MAKTTKNQTTEPMNDDIVSEDQQTTPVQNPIVITIADLKMIRDLLVVTTERGTFNSIEGIVVTSMIEKLNVFTTAVESQMNQSDSQ
jgi:hypothetical protein